jgi:CRISPR-associated exonuclease Cas4
MNNARLPKRTGPVVTMSDEERASSVARRIDSSSFDEWDGEREIVQRIRNSKPYYNEPSSVPDAERHSSHNLLQCHRKTTYQWANGSEERELPESIFWTDQLFEGIFGPYLHEAVVGNESHVRYSMGIDKIIDTSSGGFRFKSSTDPVIVNRDNESLLYLDRDIIEIMLGYVPLYVGTD